MEELWSKSFNYKWFKNIKDFTGSKLPSNSETATSFVRYTVAFNGWFKEYRYTLNNVTYNQELTKTIKATNPIFTFASSGQIVKDYANVTGNGDFLNKSKAKRSAVCQIDANNFILISTIGTKKDTKNVVTVKGMANYLINLGCKDAFNLDGGGSTTQYYKINTNHFKKIVNVETRKVADAIYFVEQ